MTRIAHNHPLVREFPDVWEVLDEAAPDRSRSRTFDLATEFRVRDERIAEIEASDRAERRPDAEERFWAEAERFLQRLDDPDGQIAREKAEHERNVEVMNAAEAAPVAALLAEADKAWRR